MVDIPVEKTTINIHFSSLALKPITAKLFTTAKNGRNIKSLYADKLPQPMT